MIVSIKRERVKSTILLTCIGGTMSPDLLYQLKKDNILDLRIIGVDANENNIALNFVDYFYKVPLGEAEGYIDAMIGIVIKEKVKVIIPGSDQEAFVLSSAREQFDQLDVKITTSPCLVLDLIRNKLITYQVLESSGISLPHYRSVSDLAGVKSAFEYFNYPKTSLVLKPIDGRGGRGLRVLESSLDLLPLWIGNGLREKRYTYSPSDEEMEEWLSEGSLMVMPALRDPAYDVDVVAVKGKAQAIIMRRRFNPVGIPFTGNTIEVNAIIYDYCKKITETLNLDGLHDIDLMTDKDGNPVLLEVNPRMSGSVAAAHCAGYPIVSLAVATILGISYPFNHPIENKEIKVFPKCIVV
jgi:carbamoyl-phosphate synthase large subunit